MENHIISIISNNYIIYVKNNWLQLQRYTFSAYSIVDKGIIDWLVLFGNDLDNLLCSAASCKAKKRNTKYIYSFLLSSSYGNLPMKADTACNSAPP